MKLKLTRNGKTNTVVSYPHYVCGWRELYFTAALIARQINEGESEFPDEILVKFDPDTNRVFYQNGKRRWSEVKAEASASIEFIHKLGFKVEEEH